MANTEVSFNVSTVVGTKVTKTVSENTTVEINSQQQDGPTQQESSPSPPWTHSLGSSQRILMGLNVYGNLLRLIRETLRTLCEKYLQHQQDLYHVFIDFKKAFDRV